MKKFCLLIVIFLSSCSSNDIKNEYFFSDEMNFEEFRIRLDEYARNNPYPNIDD